MFESNLANLTAQYQQAYLVYCYKVMQYLQVLAWLTEQKELEKQANIEQVKKKTASGIKKLAQHPNQEKSNFKSLNHLEKLDVSTIVTSGQTKGIINMGGRIYDAALGRVLQADPFVQDPTNTQSFNRYTYVFNNPLSYTDPSGYFSLRQAIGIVVGIVISIYLGPYTGKLWAAFWGGFASAAIITGSLKGAIIGGLTAGAIAAVFQGMSNLFTSLSAANAGTAVAAGGAGDVIFQTSFSAINPTVGAISATNIALGAASTSGSAQVVTEVGISIAGKAIEDVVALGRVTVIGTQITFRQIIAEAIFYQSLTEITRDMIEASFEGYATDTNMATVNAFRISTDGLQEAYAIVAKEIRIRQFQTAFLINTINVVSLASGVGGVAVGVTKGITSKLFTTTVFRVEGAVNQRVFIDAVGNVTLKGNNTLFLNFGNAARAEGFLAQRLGQGFLDTTIKTFKVPNSFVSSLSKKALVENLVFLNPGAPILVDVTKAAFQFGLRKSQIAALQKVIIKGSGL